MIAASTLSSHLKLPTFLSLHFLQPPLKPTMPSRPIAPAPPSTLSAPTKVPGQVTVTMESSIPQAPTIPVATISGQQVWFSWWLFCSFSLHGQMGASTAEVGFCSRREGEESRFPYSVLLVVGSVLLGPLNFRLSYHYLFTKLLICGNHPAELAQPGCDGRAIPKNWIFPSKLLLCQCHLENLCCRETAGIHYCSVLQLPWEEIRRD